MFISRFCHFFADNSLGNFIYNCMTDTLLELDNNYYEKLLQIQGGKADPNECTAPFLNLLRDRKIFVEEGDEKQLLISRQHKRHQEVFTGSTLYLTICPTLSCNFRCSYCFEVSQESKFFMTEEVSERLITWIKSIEGVNSLGIFWYGGEPLLAFDQICSLTDQFQSLDLDFKQAGLVTNGYLLTKEKIKRLNDLNISTVQITVDGPPEIHNARRKTAGGKATYHRIMENVTTLMESDYKGDCQIRVNLDRTTFGLFKDFQQFLREKFKGKKVIVQAGRVSTGTIKTCDTECFMTNNEWADFSIDLCLKSNLRPRSTIKPGSNQGSLCTANGHYSYVVGPEGDLYKCWNDVGIPKMKIGNIGDDDFISNPILQAEYYTGIDPYNDAECLKCSILPICGGGCANQRLRAKRFHEGGVEFCTVMKTHLHQYLRMHIHHIRTKELCNAILSPGKFSKPIDGYRVIPL